MPSHGSFSGNPKTEWLPSPADEDRNMQLLEDFSYTDPDGRIWLAPRGSVINGASIPRPLWSTVGSPYTDCYRRASVVHDVACDSSTISRKDADAMFFHACRAGGCSPSQARILYAGVRLGAWSSSNFTTASMSRKKLLFRMRITTPFVEESFLKGKLSDIADEMHGLPDDPSIQQLDDAIAKHIRF
jgi:hypothetical protein